MIAPVDRIKVLALSGSLRAASINAAALRAAVRLAPPDITVELFAGLGELPLFNPDLESAVPAAAQRFRSAVAQADALLIASPEYAHGVSGVMKNALDWLVSDVRFSGKVVAVLNTSPRAHLADASLREIFKTMDAALIGSASATIPLLGSGLEEDSMVGAPATAAALCAVLADLYAAAAALRHGASADGD